MGTGCGAGRDARPRRGLELGERGGVRVDSRLQTPCPGIYAAGDIAEYESVVHGGRRLRIEHWDVAFNQGKTAALNMLGRDQPHDVVPYFFSDLSDWASLEYVGPASSWDREIVRGSVDEGRVQRLVPRARPRRGRAVGRSIRRPRARPAPDRGGDRSR